MQMFSGACGAFTALTPCATYDVSIPDVGVRTGTINSTGLTIGQTYYVRVYSPNAVPTTNGSFNICVTDPAPANDDCGGAVTLTPGGTCTNTAGNSLGATLSSGIPLPICGTPVYDVWYKFVATSTVQTVTLSSPGATGGIFLTQVYNFSLEHAVHFPPLPVTLVLTLTAPSLTIGATYYVRVYSHECSGAGKQWRI